LWRGELETHSQLVIIVGATEMAAAGMGGHFV